MRAPIRSAKTVPEVRPVALFSTETLKDPLARIAWPEICVVLPLAHCREVDSAGECSIAEALRVKNYARDFEERLGKP